jgi:hypothetical protein
MMSADNFVDGGGPTAQKKSLDEVMASMNMPGVQMLRPGDKAPGQAEREHADLIWTRGVCLTVL